MARLLGSFTVSIFGAAAGALGAAGARTFLADFVFVCYCRCMGCRCVRHCGYACGVLATKSRTRLNISISCF